MKPPYQVTSSILNLITSISEKIGEIRSARLIRPPVELRKRNRIKTIQSSLEIEGNTLTVGQITALAENKRVLAPQKHITEVKNALRVYEMLNEFDVYKLKSLCEAHRVLMEGLIVNPGKLRTTSVGIAKGEGITHIAPSGDMVYALLKNLFRYLKNDRDILLIKSCVFHYELEFIHPFVDGNGRMGRLWQTMILKEYSPVFEFLPVETVIKQRQKDYYRALGISDKLGSSTPFIEFMLEVVNDSLEDLLRTQNVTARKTDRIDAFREIIGDEYFTRAQYLRHNKEISTATASRDLKEAVDKKKLVKTGDKRLTKYRFR